MLKIAPALSILAIILPSNKFTTFIIFLNLTTGVTMHLGAVHISRDTLWGGGGSAMLSQSYCGQRRGGIQQDKEQVNHKVTPLI